MLFKRDGEIIQDNSNGTLITSLRPSRITTGSHTHSIFKVTEDLLTSDVPLPIQDGGNYSEDKMLT
jgi:hypothetical protein